jgi:hypothetical protein
MDSLSCSRVRNGFHPEPGQNKHENAFGGEGWHFSASRRKWKMDRNIPPLEVDDLNRDVLKALLCCAAFLLLAACAGPMQLREAQARAQDRLAEYCAGRCGGLRLTHSQKIKDRWLIDFDAPAQKYTVMVDDGGNTELTVWDK